MEIGAKQFGAGCPTGPTMPPGRWISLGGTGASAYAPDFQHMLPVHREWYGCRGSFAGSFFAGISHLGELSIGTRWLCDLDDQRHKKSADRSLPENETGSHYGFAGRRDAGGGEQGIGGPKTGPAALVGRVEFAGAIGVDQAFAGIARGSDFAGSTATRLRGDSADACRAGRHGEVSHKPGTHRTGADFAANGSRAIMTATTIKMARVVQIANEFMDLQKWSRSAV
jgi:hypothetical protein